MRNTIILPPWWALMAVLVHELYFSFRIFSPLRSTPQSRYRGFLRNSFTSTPTFSLTCPTNQPLLNSPNLFFLFLSHHHNITFGYRTHRKVFTQHQSAISHRWRISRLESSNNLFVSPILLSLSHPSYLNLLPHPFLSSLAQGR